MSFLNHLELEVDEAQLGLVLHPLTEPHQHSHLPQPQYLTFLINSPICEYFLLSCLTNFTHHSLR